MFVILHKIRLKIKVTLELRADVSRHCKEEDPIESTRCTAVCSHARAHL